MNMQIETNKQLNEQERLGYTKVQSLGGILLILTLLLSACGTDTSPDTIQPDTIREEPVSVDIEPTPIPSDTEANPVTDTVAMTDTSALTDSIDSLTATEAITAGADMTPAASMSSTEAMSTTQVTTSTDNTDNTAMEDQNWLPAYDLIGQSFINADGEISGDIEDLIVDLRTGQILFAEIEYGGFLDIGDREIFVPLTALRQQTESDNITNDGLFDNTNLVLTFEEQVLEQYPNLEDNSPRLNDPLWYEDINAFWNDLFALEDETSMANNSMTTVDVTSDSIVRATDLIGFSLVDIGTGVGTIQNMLISLESSRARYLLIGFGAGATDTDPYLIPFAALDIVNVDTTEIVLDANITMDTLQFAPQFDRFLFEEQALDGEPMTVDADYIDTIDAFWEEQGFTVQ